jgi:hypothetical protein
MSQKTPRPAPLNGVDRAGNRKSLTGTSDPTDNNTEGHRQGPIAWACTFVSRRGNVGYWIRECPFCGSEHTHGGSPPPVALHRADGWRAPHCAFQAPRPTPQPNGEYYLKLGPWPARLAPCAERSRTAKNACRYLRSIGVETSDEVIPSALPRSWWRWC